MSWNARSNPPETDTGSLYRTIGSLFLGLTGIVHLVVGGSLVVLGSTNRLVRWAFLEGQTYASGTTILTEAELIATVASTGATIVGVALLLLAGATLWVAAAAFRGRHRRWWLVPSVVSVCNPLAVPLGFVAGTLLWLERRDA